MRAELSVLFSALADPTRRAILARLSKGQAPVRVAKGVRKVGSRPDRKTDPDTDAQATRAARSTSHRTTRT